MSYDPLDEQRKKLRDIPGQMDLFGGPPVARSCDPDSSHEAALRLERSGRRGSQKYAVLERLTQGPASNVELAGLCLKYTGRISDLRAEGYPIRCVRQRDTGATLYVLDEAGREASCE